MRFDLAAMAGRVKKRRRSAVVVRDIPPPTMLASDLYSSVYAPVIAAWTGASEAIIAQYARALSELQTDSAEDIGATITGVENDLLRLFLILRPSLERWTLRVEGWQRGKWRGAILSATGVDLGTMLGPADVRQTLSAVIEANVALVRSISDEARQRISSAVFRGLNERRPAVDVARDIREATGMARARAVRVAGDQLVKTTSALADERRRQAGISLWRWRHSGKRHPRADHVARDGNIYSDDAAGVGEVVEGQTVLAVPDDRPGQLPFCGCRSQSVVVF